MSGHLHITVSSGGFEANDAGPIAMVTDDADVLLDAIVASLEESTSATSRVSGSPPPTTVWWSSAWMDGLFVRSSGNTTSPVFPTPVGA